MHVKRRLLVILGLLAAGVTHSSWSPTVHAASCTSTQLACNPLKLYVTQEGLYKLSASYFTGTLGENLSNVISADLGLSNGGVQIPIAIQAGTDFGTNSSDYIEFYAHPVNNTYTTTNVYVLSDGYNNNSITPNPNPSPPSRVGTDNVGANGTPTNPVLTAIQTYADPNRHHYVNGVQSVNGVNFPAFTADNSWPSDGDPHWWDMALYSYEYTSSGGTPAVQTATSTQSFTAYLPNTSSSNGCQLTIPNAVAYTVSAAAYPTTVNPVPHNVSATINGNSIGSQTWDAPNDPSSYGSTSVSLTFNCAYLHDNSVPGQTNSVTFTNNLQPNVGGSFMYLQYFHISYPGKLCAVNHSLIWRTSGSGGYAIGGFSGMPTVWQVSGNGATVNALSNFPSATPTTSCPAGTAVEFTDNPPSGSVTYVATDSPLTSVASAVPLDESSLSLGSADFLIIANQAFEGADSAGHYPLQQLVSYEQGQGHTVKVVNVDAVLDQVGNGQPYPSAIEQFIQSNASTLKYVLLVGGDTYDYNHYLNESQSLPSGNPACVTNIAITNDQSCVPTMWVSSGFGVASSDHQFTVPYVAGCTDNPEQSGCQHSPDVAIGRLPVMSMTDLDTEVAKIVNWKTWMSGYTGTAAFGAGAPPSAGDPEGDSSFQTSSNAMLALLPSSDFPSSKVNTYYMTGALDSGGNRTQDLATAASFRSALSAGVELVNFVGHGNYTQWDTLPMFQMTSTENDVQNLTNGNKPWIVFQFGCEVADFTHGSAGDIDTALLNDTYTPAGSSTPEPSGAALTVGSTGADLAGPQEMLADGVDYADGNASTGHSGLYGYLAAGNTVGQSLEQAEKDEMAGTPSSDEIDVINSYTVLGDPTLTLLVSPTVATVHGLSALRSGHQVLVHWRVTAGTAIGFNLYGGRRAVVLNKTLIPARPRQRSYAVRVRTNARTIRLEVIAASGRQSWYTVGVR